MLFTYLFTIFASVALAHYPKSALVHGILNDLSSASQFDQQRSSPAVIIDFYSTWCTPCKILSPLLENAAYDNPSILFIKVDVDEFKLLANEFHITKLP